MDYETLPGLWNIQTFALVLMKPTLGKTEGAVMGKKGNLTELCLYIFIERGLNLREMEPVFSFTSFLARWGIFLGNMSFTFKVVV